MNPGLYRKALLAGGAALLTGLGYAVPDGLTLSEFLLALGAAVTAGGVVYGVPND